MNEAADITPRPPPRWPLRLAISLVLGALLLWLLARGGLPIVPNARTRALVAWWAPPSYLLSLMLVHFVRGARWRHLLRPIGKVPFRHIMGTAFLGFAALLFFPLRMGEVVRPYMIGHYGEVKGWEAAGTIAAERIIDGVLLTSLLLVGLQLSTPRLPFPDHIGALQMPVAAVPAMAYFMLAVFMSAFAAMALFYWRRAWGVRLVHLAIGWISERWAERLSAIVGRVAAGIGFLPSRRNTIPFVLETLLYWSLNAAGMWLLAQGCGMHSVGLAEAFVVMGVLGIGILVPAAPGFFGTYQLSIYLGLAMFVSKSDVTSRGAAYVFVGYCCQLTLHLGGALVGYWLNRQPSGVVAS